MTTIDDARNTHETPTNAPLPSPGGGPTCAKCGSAQVNKLNVRAGMQLWECAKCSFGFETKPDPSACADGGDRARVAAGEKPAREEAMAKLTCDHCPDQKFESPQALGAHRRYRHGGGGVGGRRQGKASPAKASRRPTESAPSVDAVENARALLVKRRDEILAGIPELKRIDKALAALNAADDKGPAADPS